MSVIQRKVIKSKYISIVAENVSVVKPCDWKVFKVNWKTEFRRKMEI